MTLTGGAGGGVGWRTGPLPQAASASRDRERQVFVVVLIGSGSSIAGAADPAQEIAGGIIQATTPPRHGGRVAGNKGQRAGIYAVGGHGLAVFGNTLPVQRRTRIHRQGRLRQ